MGCTRPQQGIHRRFNSRRRRGQKHTVLKCVYETQARSNRRLLYSNAEAQDDVEDARVTAAKTQAFPCIRGRALSN